MGFNKITRAQDGNNKKKKKTEKKNRLVQKIAINLKFFNNLRLFLIKEKRTIVVIKRLSLFDNLIE